MIAFGVIGVYPYIYGGFAVVVHRAVPGERGQLARVFYAVQRVPAVHPFGSCEIRFEPQHSRKRREKQHGDDNGDDEQYPPDNAPCLAFFCLLCLCGISALLIIHPLRRIVNRPRRGSRTYRFIVHKYVSDVKKFSLKCKRK